MKVFLSGTSFAPSYGGPAVSVSRLAMALAERGTEVGLWSPDGSAVTSPLLSSRSSVVRLSGPLERALDEFKGATVIHDNGVWLRHNHQLAVAAAKRGIPRIVSTRGMLEPWAIRHKRPKKKLAWGFYQKRDLVSAAALHATSEVEGENLKRLELGTLIRVIANGVGIPATDNRKTKPVGEEMVAVFLGRIYPVKGLPMLVEAWKVANPTGWRLVIAGPDEAGHLADVQSQVASAGIADAVSFPGAVHGEAKRDLLMNADLFVLPTHSESFGMAVAEAMSYGLPILTTTAAPWPVLETENAGWRAQSNSRSIADALRSATSLDRATLAAMGQRGRAIVTRDYQWSEVARQFIELYEQAAGAD